MREQEVKEIISVENFKDNARPVGSKGIKRDFV